MIHPYPRIIPPFNHSRRRGEVANYITSVKRRARSRQSRIQPLRCQQTGRVVQNGVIGKFDYAAPIKVALMKIGAAPLDSPLDLSRADRFPAADHGGHKLPIQERLQGIWVDSRGLQERPCCLDSENMDRFYDNLFETCRHHF
jgi:hypothetical protein